jgi:hypothetical protein
MNYQCIRIIVLIALATHPPTTAFAQLGILSWFSKAAKVAKVGEELSIVGKLGVLTRAEMLAVAGASGVYLDVNGAQIVVHSLQDATKAVTIGTEDLTNSLGRALSAVGADANTTRMVMTPNAVESLGPALDELVKSNKVFVFDRDVGTVPLRLEKLADGSSAYLRELTSGLYVRLDEQLGEEVIELLKAPLRTEQIRVISAFDATADADAIKLVANAAGDRLSDLSAIIRPDGTISFRKYANRTVVLIGHVEDGAFVARAADGSIARKISISALEKAAREADVTLLSAGCRTETAGASAGFVHEITDSGFSRSLSTALQAETYQGFLGALGGESPFVVSDRGLSSLAHEHRIRAEAVERFATPVNAGFRSVRLYQAIRGVIEIYETHIIAFFGLLITAFLLTFKRNRAAFMNSYPLLAAPAIQPTVYMVEWCIREFVFLLVGPFVSATVACSLPFGRWRHRDRLNVFLWSALKRPAGFLFHALAFISYLAIWFALLMAIIPFFFTISEVLRYRSEYSFSVMLLSIAIGVATFWYAQRKVPSRIVDAVAAKDWPPSVRLISMWGMAAGIVLVGFVASTLLIFVGSLL